MLVDDMGVNDLNASYGSAPVPTPHMDGLAAEGTRFTRHYANSTCSPARAALLTGSYPARFGFSPNGPGLSEDTSTLPRELRRLGYATYHVGKWHLGHFVRSTWPDGVGFDDWFGFLSQWLIGAPYSLPHDDGSFGQPRYRNPWLQGANESPQQIRGHLSDQLVDRTVKMVHALSAQGQPWFLNHWFYLPHTPLQPPLRYEGIYPDTHEGRYQAAIAQLDDSVGEILDALEASGQLERTIVVLVSDNGGTEIGFESNAPFFGTKTSLEEGGLRTPLIIRWPGSQPHPPVVDHVVSIMDLMPTLIRSAGGVPPAGIDGRDLADLLATDGESNRPLFWTHASSGRYAFSVLSEDARFRLVYSGGGGSPGIENVLLRDLEADPSGTNDYAAAYPAVVADLIDAYGKWFHDVHSLRSWYLALSESGLALMTGDDLQRTVGDGEFTFAIAIDPGGMSSGATVVAAQSGFWGVDYDSASRSISVEFGAGRLRGSLPATSGCHSILVTGSFHRRTTNWPGDTSRFNVELIVDGVSSDYMEIEAALPRPDSTAPWTHIGWFPGRTQFVGRLSEPILFNVPVGDDREITPAFIHERTCDSLNGVSAI